MPYQWQLRLEASGRSPYIYVWKARKWESLFDAWLYWFLQIDTRDWSYRFKMPGRKFNISQEEAIKLLKRVAKDHHLEIIAP